MEEEDFHQKKINTCKLNITALVKQKLPWEDFEIIGRNSQLRDME